ncbi:MAG TPA: phosphatidylinositol-specific phospholipase C/glycerophosphodiester phosphodiesterase family protein [Mucilaginibacter sp.]
MRLAILSVKLLKTFIFVFLTFGPLTVFSQSQALPNAFAHNDYFHNRPLFDALDNGYTNIEADIFLRRGKLIVAHIIPWFKGGRTLDSLYLKPLKKHIANNGNKVYKGYNEPVILMIDIKSDAEDTYAALEKVLDHYKDILSGYENGGLIKRQVTIVLSGHKPYNMLKAEKTRYAFIDEDLRDSGKDQTPNVYQLSSCKYSKILNWDGDGLLPEKDREMLRAYCRRVHSYHSKVRLWASPEKQNCWGQLLDCGVDLINTDKLVDLKVFLIAREKERERKGNKQIHPQDQIPEVLYTNAAASIPHEETAAEK